MTFDVGDLAILVYTENPSLRCYVGHVFEITSPLMESPFGQLEHSVIPPPAGYMKAWCAPRYLMKITPPADMRSEDTDEPIEVIVR